MATIEEKIRVLTEEVRILTSRTKSAGTGYLYTAIDVINGRIAELKLEATEEMTVSEQMQEELEPINTFDCGPIDRTAVTQEEMRKFYNNGPHIGARENDDGTWDMSAAARMATDDDVKHTEEYYDKNRNRAVETLL